MEEDSQDDKVLGSFLGTSTRYRSPVFTREEIKALVNLIEKYKHIVQSKSTSTSSSQAKEVTWAKIEKLFNNQGFGHTRSADSLKTKWENLKKDARKMSKNIMDPNHSDLNGLNAQILSIMCDAENSGPIDASLDFDDEIDNGLEEHKESTNNSSRYWDESGEKQTDDDSTGVDADNEKSGRTSRSMNFTPQECSLLLQCVKKEKTHVFSKEVTGKALELKNQAWARVTNSYNRLSPEKRSTKVLRTKFGNMKRMARSIGFKGYLKNIGGKHEKLVDDSKKKIKKEPLFEFKIDADSDLSDDNDDDESSNHKSDDNYVNIAPDPLSSVLNGDAEIGSDHVGSCNQSDNKEVVKLKLELLNFRLENAKLERKRMEEALQEEATTRESRAVETALRLRAARLDALAAEMKFPPSHPALHYTPQEARAQQYLSQYHQT